MIDALEVDFVLSLLSGGFIQAPAEDPKCYRYAGSEIALLRWKGSFVQELMIDFYGDPKRPFYRISVHCFTLDEFASVEKPLTNTRRDLKRSWWGRRRFRFARWSKESPKLQADKLASEAVALMPQIMDYFDHGKVGPNIGPSHKLVASKPHDEAI